MTEHIETYLKLIKQKEVAEEDLISLDKHIRALAEYFAFWEWTDVANWFWIASSIVNVEYDGVRYDSAFSYCAPAYEYETEKQKIHSNLINQLTVFLYVYSGFESLISRMNFDNCPTKKGKINAPKYFLKTEFENTFSLLPKYKEILSTLRSFIVNSSFQESNTVFKLDDCTGISGVGLKVVYSLRNRLAHGDYSFPEPLDWTYELPLQPEIIELSIRLLLMTIQMLFLAEDKGNFKTLELYESSVIETNEDDEWYIDEYEFLWRIHVNKINKMKCN